MPKDFNMKSSSFLGEVQKKKGVKLNEFLEDYGNREMDSIVENMEVPVPPTSDPQNETKPFSTLLFRTASASADPIPSYLDNFLPLTSETLTILPPGQPNKQNHPVFATFTTNP